MSTTGSLERLFQPIHLGDMEIKNRFVLAPMATNFSSGDGLVTEQLKAYYEGRAKGGAGLVMVEESCIDAPVGKGGACQLYIDDDKQIPGLSELAGVIQKYGAKAGIQLHHAGRLAATRYTGCQPVAPSAIVAPGGDMPRELSIAEIEAIVDGFARGAARAQKAGFDGIEIQCVHGYLLSEFLSADSNKRRDAYGGSLENRVKIVLDIIRTVRSRVGHSYPVWARLTVREFHTDNGINPGEAKQLAHWLEESGMVALNVTADHIRSNFGMAWPVEGEAFPRPPMDHPHGFIIPLIAEIKKVVKIPIMAIGWMTSEVGEAALRADKIDMVVMARPLLADPEIPNKTASGKLDEIRPCIGCLMCREQFLLDKGVACAVNAQAGREYECPIIPTETKKRVVVVGGGAAGMEAARVAALRGHEVTLLEKDNRLGGQLLLASLPPYKGILAELVDYFRVQMERLGIKVELGREATVETVLSAKPNAVVVATGATRAVPDLPGIEIEKVVDAADVLTGKAAVGDEMVIIGGGIIGCETAEFLAAQGKKVTVVEMLDNLATGMERTHRQFLLQRLDGRGVNLMVRTEAQAVAGDGVLVRMADGKERTLAADTVVLAIGVSPNQQLYQALRGKVGEIYQVGDCVEPRHIFEAISEGFLAGQVI